MAQIETLFATRLYRAKLGGRNAAALNRELRAACLAIARDDKAGRAWAKKHAYAGYTSYSSLSDLTTRAPPFADLQRHLDHHVAAFARALHFDLGRRKLKLDGMWINILKPGGVHTGHIHPLSVVSGTYYVATPKGSSALRFEDPRLGLMMAAPAKRPSAPRSAQPFAYINPTAGSLILFESWLRHEVPPNGSRQLRISISFNYA